MKRNFITLLIISLLFSLIPSSIFATQYDNFDDCFIAQNFTKTINDFRNFTQVGSSQYISSTKNLNTITMDMYVEWGVSHDTYQKENFILLLDNLTNCYEFSISILIEYSSNEENLESFGLEAGSYYKENGDYNGKPSEGSYSPIARAYITEKSDLGYYGVSGYPLDATDDYATNWGSLTKNGVVQFKMHRIQNIVNCSINQDGVSKINHTWTSGIMKNLNYIRIWGGVYLWGNTDTEGTFRALSATVGFESYVTETTSGDLIGKLDWIWIGGSIFVIIATSIIVPILIIRRKKKGIPSNKFLTENNIEDQEEHSLDSGYSWDYKSEE